MKVPTRSYKVELEIGWPRSTSEAQKRQVNEAFGMAAMAVLGMVEVYEYKNLAHLGRWTSRHMRKSLNFNNYPPKKLIVTFYERTGQRGKIILEVNCLNGRTVIPE